MLKLVKEDNTNKDLLNKMPEAVIACDMKCEESGCFEESRGRFLKQELSILRELKEELLECFEDNPFILRKIQSIYQEVIERLFEYSKEESREEILTPFWLSRAYQDIRSDV